MMTNVNMLFFFMIISNLSQEGQGRIIVDKNLCDYIILIPCITLMYEYTHNFILEFNIQSD